MPSGVTAANHVTEEDSASYLADVPLAEVAERAAKEGGSSSITLR